MKVYILTVYVESVTRFGGLERWQMLVFESYKTAANHARESGLRVVPFATKHKDCIIEEFEVLK